MNQDTCYTSYYTYELTITQAVKKLNLYLANRDDPALAPLFLQSFMDECANNKCDDATAALLSSLTGTGGLFACDMLNILYYGDVSGGYYQGWRDNVTAKSAYILSLVNMGMISQSAYFTLETQNESAWRVVQATYGDDVVAAGTRIE